METKYQVGPMRSNFDRIVKMNEVAGNRKGDPNNQDRGSIELGLKLIKDELREAYDHFEEGDFAKMRDDVQDLLVTSYGLGHRMGFPVDEDFLEVYLSNMTKFDTSEADAELTYQKYDKIGVATMVRHTNVDGKQYYVTVSAVDQVGLDGKEYPAGKFLKSYKFKEPEYRRLDSSLVEVVAALRSAGLCIELNKDFSLTSRGPTIIDGASTVLIVLSEMAIKGRKATVPMELLPIVSSFPFDYARHNDRRLVWDICRSVSKYAMDLVPVGKVINRVEQISFVDPANGENILATWRMHNPDDPEHADTRMSDLWYKVKSAEVEA